MDIHTRVELLRDNATKIGADVRVHNNGYVHINVMNLIDDLYEQYLLQQDDGK